VSGTAVLNAHQAIRDRIGTALARDRIAVIDMGSSRFSCLMADIRHSMLDRTLLDRETDVYAALRVFAATDVPASGMKGGVIEDEEAAASALRRLLKEMQRLTGIMPKRAVFALAGGSPRSMLATASSAIPVRMVDDAAVGRVMASCRQEIALRIRRPIHIEPLDFSINGVDGIRDPRGRAARTLGVRFGIVTVERDALERLGRVAGAAGLTVSGVACSAAASGFASLTQDELDIGATVVDIGANVTGIASFEGNRLRSVHSISIGGAMMTSDLSEAMGIGFDEAEAMKIASRGGGISADPSVLGGAGPGEATMVMVGVIRPRVEELFELVRAALPMGAVHPVVLTGGGSRLPGMVEAGGAVLGRRVRLGQPIRTRGAPTSTLGPDYAATHGLLAHAVRLQCDPWAEAMQIAQPGEKAFGSLRQWLRDNW
jgi:cell division protein FtsA